MSAIDEPKCKICGGELALTHEDDRRLVFNCRECGADLIVYQTLELPEDP